MKKALQISIAKTLFTIEEDAYDALNAYLESLKRHFESTEGKDEIISDIETRIAEELVASKENPVTLATVEKIMAQMGSADDLNDDEASPKSQPLVRGKKLYRDSEDKIISGLCAGLAKYFDIDPLWVRLAFVVGTLLNGLGLLIYLVMWLLLSEAKTASQKLEMAGTPVTIETLKETASERIAEMQSGKSRKIGRAISVPFIFLGKFLRVFIGVVMALVSGAAIVAIVSASGFLMSGSTVVADGISAKSLLPGGLYWVVLACAMATLVIPFLFVFIAGIAAIFKKTLINSQFGLGLLGIWIVALAVSGFGVARVADNYQTIINTSPEYREITREIQLSETFSVLKVKQASVMIIESTSTDAYLEASGRAKSIDSYEIRAEGGELVIEPKNEDNWLCFLCFFEEPTFILFAPALENISAVHGSRVESNALPSGESLELLVEHGSRVELGALELEVLMADIRHGSRVDLSGSAATSTIKAEHGSRLEAQDFDILNADLETRHGSVMEVSVSETLDARAEHGSVIRYRGEPDIMERASNGSSIHSL